LLDSDWRREAGLVVIGLLGRGGNQRRERALGLLACGLNRRRRRIRHGTAGGKRCRACRKETEGEAKWDASRDFSAIIENTGTSL
jgi:hypothetical protein